MTSLRSTLIGIWMGITPGGATPASFMSYGLAKKMSPNGGKFGKGEIEGVVAPETAAHAAGTSALLPMLALGIPGSPTAAVLLGGLLIWGLQPGPLLFVEQKDFVWGLIASMYLGNIVGLIIVLTTVPLFASILRVPFSIIAPVIIVICAIGAYTVHNAMLDIWFMLGFGVIGYLFKKLDYPLAPLVLALVLGDKAEDSFRQSMLMSQGERVDHVVQPAGRLDHHAGAAAAVVAADLAACWRRSGRPSPRNSRKNSRWIESSPLQENRHASHRPHPGNGLARQGRRAAAGAGGQARRHAPRGGSKAWPDKMRVPTSLISRLREGKAGLVERLPTDKQQDRRVHRRGSLRAGRHAATWCCAAGAPPACCGRCAHVVTRAHHAPVRQAGRRG